MTCHWGRADFSINNDGKIVYPYVKKKRNCVPIPYLIPQNSISDALRLKYERKTWKLVEDLENIYF